MESTSPDLGQVFFLVSACVCIVYQYFFAIAKDSFGGSSGFAV